jgi:hypothetical protein
MDHAPKMDIHLAHHIDVSAALKFLVHELGCESWYVACHHEHLFVFRLTSGTTDKFAVRFECTAPVEKGIYHDSKAWSLSISALHYQPELGEQELKQIQTGLEALG